MDEKTITVAIGVFIIASLITTEMIEPMLNPEIPVTPMDPREKYAKSSGTQECLHVTCAEYDGFDYNDGVCKCYSGNELVLTTRYY